MNRLNSLKHMQPFDAYNSNQKKRRKKYLVYNFFKRIQYVETILVSTRKFTDMEYDYN